MLNAANQMFKAVAKTDVPKELVDASLKEVVHHLRNLLEHWEDNRQYFLNSDIVIPVEHKTGSARWYKLHFPNSTPWAGGWSNLEGYAVGGALYLGQLHAQTDRLMLYAEARAV